MSKIENSSALSLTSRVDDIQITISESAQAHKASTLALYKGLPDLITTPEEEATVVAVCRDLATIRKTTEATRKELKAPVIALGKKIEDTANSFSDEVEKAEKQLIGRVNNFHARLEAERQGEERRQQAALKAEQDRIARLETEAAAALKAGDTAKAEELADAAALAEFEATEMAPQQTAIATSAVKGVNSKKVTDFTVIGLKEIDQKKSLIKLALQFPELVNIEVRKSDVLDRIQRLGVTELPGLNIFERFQTSVR